MNKVDDKIKFVFFHVYHYIATLTELQCRYRYTVEHKAYRYRYAVEHC